MKVLKPVQIVDKKDVLGDYFRVQKEYDSEMRTWNLKSWKTFRFTTQTHNSLVKTNFWELAFFTLAFKRFEVLTFYFEKSFQFQDRKDGLKCRFSVTSNFNSVLTPPSPPPFFMAISL